jgi:hypothetical protein
MRAVLVHALRSKRQRDWKNFRGEARESVKPSEFVEPVGDSAWLIRADDPALTLGSILHLTLKYSVVVRTLEVQVDAQWKNYLSPTRMSARRHDQRSRRNGPARMGNTKTLRTNQQEPETSTTPPQPVQEPTDQHLAPLDTLLLTVANPL